MEIRIYIYGYILNMNQIDFLKCLADQTRLDILMLILKQGERCVCDFTALLELSQPKISRHLALLRATQIVQDRRQGQWVYYRLHADLPNWCIDVLNRIAQENPRFEADAFNLQKNPQTCE